MNARLTAKPQLLRFILLLVIALCIGAASLRALAEDATSAAPAEGVLLTKQAPEVRFTPPASNIVGYWFGPGYHTVFVRDPNSSAAATIQRNTAEFQHLSFWKFGSHFADIYLNKSNSAEPTTSNSGATEIYGIFREKIGLNEISGTQAFHFGPIRDVALEVGTNLETKNSVYGPAERTLYIGPNIQFNIPRGFLNVGFHARKEWNKQEIFGKSENYSPNFNIEPTWLIPIPAGKFHLAYSGCADYNTQKGVDSFGNPTVSEFMVRNFIAADLGGMLFHQSERLEVNAGVWYWHNEFGKPSSNPGGEQVAPIFGVSFHLGRKGEARLSN